jgi:hypothetical protein
MNKVKLLSFLVAMISIYGCSAIKSLPEAQGIEIVNITPDEEKCKYIGEVVGSQGNWFTGDYTSNENLVVGARNELRNEAYKLGANIVYMSDMKNTNAWGSLGTTNTTAIGKAYLCSK